MGLPYSFFPHYNSAFIHNNNFHNFFFNFKIKTKITQNKKQRYERRWWQKDDVDPSCCTQPLALAFWKCERPSKSYMVRASAAEQDEVGEPLVLPAFSLGKLWQAEFQRRKSRWHTTTWNRSIWSLVCVYFLWMHIRTYYIHT